MNAITFINGYSRTDALATAVERMLFRCNIPGTVTEVVIEPDRVWLSIAWRCDVAASQDGYDWLIHHIRRTFGCYGGVDFWSLDVVLQPTRPQMHYEYFAEQQHTDASTTARPVANQRIEVRR